MNRAFHLTKPVWASNSYSQSHVREMSLSVFYCPVMCILYVTVFKAQNNRIHTVFTNWHYANIICKSAESNLN